MILDLLQLLLEYLIDYLILTSSIRRTLLSLRIVIIKNYFHLSIFWDCMIWLIFQYITELLFILITKSCCMVTTFHLAWFISFNRFSLYNDLCIGLLTIFDCTLIFALGRSIGYQLGQHQIFVGNRRFVQLLHVIII